MTTRPQTTDDAAEPGEVLPDVAYDQLLEVIDAALDAFEAAEAEGDLIRVEALREAIVTAWDALEAGGDFATEIVLQRAALRPVGGWLS